MAEFAILGGSDPRPGLLFYCQHSLGIGHLMRSFALCQALSARYRVQLLCGGRIPEGISPPGSFDVIALPPTRVSHDSRRPFTLGHPFESRCSTRATWSAPTPR